MSVAPFRFYWLMVRLVPSSSARLYDDFEGPVVELLRRLVIELSGRECAEALLRVQRLCWEGFFLCTVVLVSGAVPSFLSKGFVAHGCGPVVYIAIAALPCKRKMVTRKLRILLMRNRGRT